MRSPQFLRWNKCQDQDQVTLDIEVRSTQVINDVMHNIQIKATYHTMEKSYAVIWWQSNKTVGSLAAHYHRYHMMTN